jgi:hypothetical protein
LSGSPGCFAGNGTRLTWTTSSAWMRRNSPRGPWPRECREEAHLAGRPARIREDA